MAAKRQLPLLSRALAQHRSALAACRRCGLDDPEILPVLSHARAPKIMLVGQAPGKVEVVDRTPFAGRAGRTLFRWLEDAGVDEETFRDKVYIAAITRCFPGPSPSGRGDRVPSPRERELCGSWLDAELEMIRPRLLIPVGRLAIDRFLGNRPLEDVIGRKHTVRHAGGESVVIPLPHPSGASSWIHHPGHRQLLDRSLEYLSSAFRELAVLPSHTTNRRTNRSVA